MGLLLLLFIAWYDFPGKPFELNGVPFFLVLVTQAYFMLYFTFTTIVLRKCWGISKNWSSNKIIMFIINSIPVIILSVFTAFMETWTISHVPVYHHKDKFMMYTFGSVFYGIYFFVSFPMFYRIDESLKNKWNLKKTIIDSMAACMIVTILLDTARLLITN